MNINLKNNSINKEQDKCFNLKSAVKRLVSGLQLPKLQYEKSNS